jgi:hypothetical protein
MPKPSNPRRWQWPGDCTDEGVRMAMPIRPIIGIALAGVLAIALAWSGIACPLWMSVASRGEGPCSEHNRPSPEQCPAAICAAGSPAVTSGGDVSFAMMEAAEPVEPAAAAAVPWVIRVAHPEDRPPPVFQQPLFLRSHSLLI